MDVFNTFIELLRQTGNVAKGQNEINETRQVFVVIIYVSFAVSSEVYFQNLIVVCVFCFYPSL